MRDVDRASVKAAVYARLRAHGAFACDDSARVIDGAATTRREDDDDDDDDDDDENGLRWARASLTRLPSSSSRFIRANVGDEARVMHYVFSYWRALSALAR